MADITLARNLVKSLRDQRSWSQAELARRAGISRAAVSAIEVNRLVPSVATGLALARGFGCPVEALFQLIGTDPTEAQWAWPPAQVPCRYWQARVRSRTLCYPAEATIAGGDVHDGVFRGNTFLPSGEADPETTLVIACCDPASGLLVRAYAEACGLRLLVLQRSSSQALSLLGEGLVHAAGVHYATVNEPSGNGRTVLETLGPGYRLLRIARWQEGLASSTRIAMVGTALRAKLRWVGREPGSAARACLDELRPNGPPPRRLARDHRGVAEAVRCGWADVGVCHRLAAEEAGLRFFGVRDEHFDLCYPAGEEGDPRLAALIRVTRSATYRRLLGEVPGYATVQSGEVQDAC
jgi:molybdate-binding protein/DNA-binding XRE family transcriptional regulator